MAVVKRKALRFPEKKQRARMSKKAQTEPIIRNFTEHLSVSRERVVFIDAVVVRQR
jgi:hypothetical protein